MSDERRFIYVDAKGRATCRHVADVTETAIHLQAIYATSGFLRTFRKDRILQEVTDDTLIQQRIDHFQAGIDEKTGIRHSVARQSIPGVLEVCFTGFKAPDRDRLTTAAESGVAVN